MCLYIAKYLAQSKSSKLIHESCVCVCVCARACACMLMKELHIGCAVSISEISKDCADVGKRWE